MALVTVPIIRDHVETDLTDDALQRLVDDADSEIVRRHLGHAEDGDITVVKYPEWEHELYLDRKAVTITAVVEFERDETSLLLASDDFRLEGDQIIRRLINGTNGRNRWTGRVDVTYAPFNDDVQRRRVIIDLVKIAVEYQADRTVGVSNTSEYNTERERLIRLLAPPLIGYFA